MQNFIFEFRLQADEHYTVFTYLWMSWNAWSISWPNVASQREQTLCTVCITCIYAELCAALYSSSIFFMWKSCDPFWWLRLTRSSVQLFEIHVRCSVQLILIIVYSSNTHLHKRIAKCSQSMHRVLTHSVLCWVLNTLRYSRTCSNKTNICLAKWATRVSCCRIYN